jgi:hypothetical protein
MGWVQLAQDWNQWQVPKNTVIYLETVKGEI